MRSGLTLSGYSTSISMKDRSHLSMKKAGMSLILQSEHGCPSPQASVCQQKGPKLAMCGLFLFLK